MKEKPLIILKADGEVDEVNSEAAQLLGIPAEDLTSKPLTPRLIEEHRIRFNAELEAFSEEEQRHGRVHCTVVGLDGIRRRLKMVMTAMEDGRINTGLSLYQHPDSTPRTKGSSLLSAGRLLPVARRISTVVRNSASKEELLESGLNVFVEVTSASAGAILEWEDSERETPIVTAGPFLAQTLQGVFRPAVLARLTRGDVVVKDARIDGVQSDMCLIIVPLLSGATPHGVVVLSAEGYSVLVPEEQQMLAILGEIMGLGLRVLSSSARRDSYAPTHRGDAAASIALGRLSAGLAHEINNAATVLRNNLEQIMRQKDGIGVGALDDYTIKDSITALDSIFELNDALRAFTPEETPLLEKLDLLPVLGMVVRAVRFYAKRGMNVVLERPRGPLPLAVTKSHYLIRSLFLILVELVEASIDSGIALNVLFGLDATDDTVTLTITITAGPFSLPTVLLAQLEKGGALTRHITTANGKLSHVVDHKGNLVIEITLKSAEHADEPDEELRAQAPHRRGRILIADEEVAVIRSLRRLLEQNHDVLAARTGEAGHGQSLHG